MAARKKTRAREAQLGFEALSIEGGLLSPDWLSRAAQLSAGGQSEADYRIPKGLNLRDEIGRYWRIAQANWSELVAGRAGHADARLLAERFVEALLRDSFGFVSLAKAESAVIDERAYPIGFAALGGRVPVVVAPAGTGLDALAPAFGDGGRRRSAFGLAQEYLNAADGAMWGLASDGLTLRIVRDNASLTRPAWIEADLQRIFTEERYADFAALWLLAHETRFGRPDQPVTDCALEIWRNAGREEGTRAREHLRRGVEEALLVLGQGFLAHPDNLPLRTALQSGALGTKDYFNQLLRLVYRLIFVLTVEERGLLHPEGTDETLKALYAEGYSLRRLRERSVKRSAHDRFADLWETTKIVFRGVGAGEPRLGLPALAGIFAAGQCGSLDTGKLDNRALLLAMFRLSWLREASGLARVNWRDMGPEELGSVYESLLELVPQITMDGREFAFAKGSDAKGNARKTSGSYYTPDSLVQALLDSALEPVVQDTIARHPDSPVESLLSLSIVDPACGSGHFLLAAARRLAAHVARFQVNGTPSAAEYRHALRQVVSRCIYGVDLNPLAIELCKVSLWMEAVEPGLPLTFLNSHIQHGNALLGATPALMGKGIPDAAWEPIEGDDKKVASALKKRNKLHANQQQTAWDFLANDNRETAVVNAAVADLEAASDANPDALAKKESQWAGILGSAEYRRQKFVADAWCAAFVWPKLPGEYAEAAPTNELWRRLRDQQAQAQALTVAATAKLVEQYRFFHWHLQFPQVFEKGGFDVVVGNPPWESLLFREEEFFTGPRPDIAQAATAAARKKLIAKLEIEDPALFVAYRAGLREVNGTNAFVRAGVRYPLCGVGRVNLFALFAEAARTLVSIRGRVGQILPSGIVSDDSTKLFFQSVVEQRQLVSFFDFENREGLFPAIDSRIRFGILTLAGERRPGSDAEFAFFATRTEHLKDLERRFTLSSQDIALLNPTTKTCPVFRSVREAEISKGIYRRIPVLASSGWKLEVRRLLNSADDSGSFLDQEGEGRLRLYEGKHFWHFEHRWATRDAVVERQVSEREHLDPGFAVQPRYWYPEQDVQLRFTAAWKHTWVLALRKITNATNERTFVAGVIPSLAVSDSAKVFFLKEEYVNKVPSLSAALASFMFDFIARGKLSGTNMSAYVAEQIPLLSPSTLDSQPTWSDTSLYEWTRQRALELTYTAWDLEAFAHDVGYDGPPFRWNPERRFLLRCELDAAFFQLYGLSRDDTDYVMDSFPIVRKNDEKAHGEYRTKRVILEMYDAMADAERNGQPYQTRLSPPPADPRVAHPARTSIEVSPPRRVIAPRPLPDWGSTILAEASALASVAFADNAWATGLSGEHLGTAALAAVLRNLPSPRTRDEVERAVVLVLLPRLMLPSFDLAAADAWRAAIGSDNLAVTSVAAFQIPWNQVIRTAIQQNVLVQLPNGSWSAGTEVDDGRSAVFDARALVVLAWLATVPAAHADVTKEMGDLRAA